MAYGATTIGERGNCVNVNGAEKNGESMKGANTSGGSDTVPDIACMGQTFITLVERYSTDIEPCVGIRSKFANS